MNLASIPLRALQSSTSSQPHTVLPSTSPKADTMNSSLLILMPRLFQTRGDSPRVSLGLLLRLDATRAQGTSFKLCVTRPSNP